MWVRSIGKDSFSINISRFWWSDTDPESYRWKVTCETSSWLHREIDPKLINASSRVRVFGINDPDIVERTDSHRSFQFNLIVRHFLQLRRARSSSASSPICTLIVPFISTNSNRNRSRWVSHTAMATNSSQLLNLFSCTLQVSSTCSSSCLMYLFHTPSFRLQSRKVFRYFVTNIIDKLSL